MVILITGCSHTGKTFLAQKLLERHCFPYLSIDYLKMGLIRSGQTELTAEDDDKLMDYLWPMVSEIIKTAIENKQNLIVEGCYIPFDFQKSFSEKYLASIKYLCLIFSQQYVRLHYEDIIEHENAIEERGKEEYSKEMLLKENEKMLYGCKEQALNFVVIEKDYISEINSVLERIKEEINEGLVYH